MLRLARRAGKIRNSKFIESDGFTLLELILVVAVLAILAVLGSDFYGNYERGAAAKASVVMLAADLKLARDRAMAGEADRNWGVRLVNSTADYYEIFSTPTDYADPAKAIAGTTHLANGVTMAVPDEGASQDFIFTKISATTTPGNIVLDAWGMSESIVVSAAGVVE